MALPEGIEKLSFTDSPFMCGYLTGVIAGLGHANRDVALKEMAEKVLQIMQPRYLYNAKR